MKRGDIVAVAAPGDYGKPRPALIIQSDHLNMTDSVLVSLLTSTTVETPFYRLSLKAGSMNGLKADSRLMIDKIIAIPRAKCGKVIGRIAESETLVLNHMLAVMMGLAD